MLLVGDPAAVGPLGLCVLGVVPFGLGLLAVGDPAVLVVAALAARPGVELARVADDVFEVTGSTTEEIAEAAAAARVVVHELTPVQTSLEEAYMRLTADDVEYRTTATPSARTAGAHR